MSQYFIESRHPSFFSFNQIIQNRSTDLDFDLLLKEFQENNEKEQQTNFLKYWHKQGEECVLQTWNEKYKYYLQGEEDSQTENCNKQEAVDISETQTPETCESDSVFAQKSWEDLWKEHREEIYYQQYSLFTTINYKYLLDLKSAFEIIDYIQEDLEEISQINEESDHLNLTQDIEQLSILGLPTSFVSRAQNSNNKHKTSSSKSTINYSGFFSDSEMENEFHDSDEDSKIEDSLHNVQKKIVRKLNKRKRNRKLKNAPSFMLEERGLLKYWHKRFSLFSRFDEGIQLDRESWFSVTPEKVAKHLADRLKCSIIVDGFCGSGGNAIQFALTCDKVIAIDIDPSKLELAKHNAAIYNVSKNIEFILGDFMHLAASGKLKADVVFLSPPWGGPKYKTKKEFNIEKFLQPVKGSELVEASRNISDNIALFLPRNSSIKQIVKLAGIGNRCEIEHNYLDTRLVAITALYGEEILSQEPTN